VNYELFITEAIYKMSLKRIKLFISVWLCFSGFVYAETLTLPRDKRPDWLQKNGIVMAGSWEPLPFRIMRDRGGKTSIPTESQINDYQYEHSPQMLDELKSLGVNFIMTHCYKGMGLKAERQSMADAVEFARLCREKGLHVGVYNYSGSFLWESFFKEMPQAKEWILLTENGKPVTYSGAPYRYFWNRNHPDAQVFYKQIIRFAVEDIKADLLHFDNYSRYGPGFDENSIQRFRRHLEENFTPAQRIKMKVKEVDRIRPPTSGCDNKLLRRVWLKFVTDSMTQSYYQVNQYARSLRSDILIENNSQGVGNRIRVPIDHGRMLRGGEAFWNESRRIGYSDNQLRCRIRTYKVARKLNNMAFSYTTTPLEMAESMAFNLGCLGCICWFEYGKIVASPGSKQPMNAEQLTPFIKFFNKRGTELLKDAEVIADVAILRSFPSQVFADAKYANLNYKVEQALIENRIPFQIIYDSHLNDLKKYNVLVLAGCVAMPEGSINHIRDFVKSGGRLCIIGSAVIYDNWLSKRKRSAFDNLPKSSIVRIEQDGDFLKAIKQCNGEDFSLSIKAPPGLCTELTENNNLRFVHLVNYRDDGPVKNVRVQLRLPAESKIESVTLASPGRCSDIRTAFTQAENLVTFEISSVNVYEIAVISNETKCFCYETEKRL